MMRTSEFYEQLPTRRCDTCSEPLEEMADCHSCTCTKCRGVTFYPLSPLQPSLPLMHQQPSA
ncbi:protein YhfH [Paenibacillus sp. YYML68]|uniref:protein YhfH n=1 Tax=Paenibacillus sp. YYML68 TaxID=2909250 RepID=UPI0024926D4F|nr:protein YhfH [Paenibacillus sp. YYML68]